MAAWKMKRTLRGLLAITMLGANAAAAQDRPTVTVAVLPAAPVIDGDVGEDEWAGASVVDERFIQIEPEFGQPSPFRSVVRIGQTSAALYVAFESYDPEPDRLSAAVTGRDGDVGGDDAVGVVLDTFRDGRTAYAFATNVLATQWDARIADNGRTTDVVWDEAWACASRRHGDRWTTEFEIPFAILRFEPGEDRTWGLSLMRTVPRRLEVARSLLLAVDRPVGDVAGEMGFTTPAAFSRWFTRVDGRSPRAFRSDPEAF